jgi:hypothetical protein
VLAGYSNFLRTVKVGLLGDYTGYQYQIFPPPKSLQQSSYQFQCQNNNFDYQFTQFFFQQYKETPGRFFDFPKKVIPDP